VGVHLWFTMAALAYQAHGVWLGVGAGASSAASELRCAPEVVQREWQGSWQGSGQGCFMGRAAVAEASQAHLTAGTARALWSMQSQA